LTFGTSFISASEEKSAFVGVSSGRSFDSDFSVGSVFSIILGKELQNSQGMHLGTVGLGAWDGFSELNYGYRFLRTGNWSLGIEASALYGGLVILNLGGKIGFYTRLKISKSFDLGLQIGTQTLKELAEESEWTSEDIHMYVLVGLRYYF